MTNKYIPPLCNVTWDAEMEAHLNDADKCVHMMVSAYLTCAEWADRPDDEGWSEAEFSQEAKDLAWFECCAFLRLAKWHIKDWTMDQLGHDFWLTRNRHGAGFWDRDFGTEESRQALTKLSDVFGEIDLVMGDDGLLYLE